MTGTPTAEPLLPGTWIGIVGGGQLGRMLALEAHRLGYRTCILDPVPDCPAGQVAHRQIVADYGDLDAMARLARLVSVITYEFENVDVAAIAAVESERPVFPGSHVLHVVQNRIREKETLSQYHVPVTGFRPVAGIADLRRAIDDLGLPVVLKTATWGYDGKGQIVIDASGQLETAYRQLSGAGPLICEAFVPYVKEISVICARTAQGETVCYPPAENVHRQGILDVTVFPARIDANLADQAQRLARQIAEALDLIGLLAVEMFVTKDGSLLVNELAPRPHNSGHVTLDAGPVSQFEQLLRVLCRLPLGETQPYRPAAMANLLGDLWCGRPQGPNFAALLDEPGVRLHLYGKAEARPGRKMGHICALAASPDEALSMVLRARQRLLQ